jgi:hypothetical protein
LYNATTINIFSNNYYYEYFESYPFDVFVNFTTTELEGNYDVSATVVDLHPMYNSAWYNQDKQIHVRYFSNYNGMGVQFIELRLYIDNEWIGTEDPIVTDLVFRITIKDFLNNTITDFLYNYNTTSNIFLGFNIGQVEFRNDGNMISVIFLKSSTTTISFDVNPATSRNIYMIDDIYEMWIENKTGYLHVAVKDIEVENGGYFNVTIGTVIIVVPPINPIFQSLTLADVVQILVIASVVVVIIIVIATIINRIGKGGKNPLSFSKTKKRARARGGYIY